MLLNLSRLLLTDAYKNDRTASSRNVDIKYLLFSISFQSLVLPANSRGEIITTCSKDIQEYITRKLKKKQRQLKLRSTLEKWLALLLQVFWVGALVVIAPLLSSIQRIGDCSVC